ncbi:MAG: hypothetical protein ACRCXX_14270 [Cetobacterium sp.]|uniref:hypothetical protein n=1 Tax=Cetobacterium sp. TaxID=2071632 RepID=UPI003F3441BD
MVKDTEFYLSLASQKSKDTIRKWLISKDIQIEEITLDEMANSISSLKQLLNEEVKFCSQITVDDFGLNLSSALIVAKENKIDKLIDIYNSSNTYNKTQFNDRDEIDFSKITTLKVASVEIDDFDYECPVGINIIFTTHDGEITSKNIIPYNYNGLYKELIEVEEFASSKFKVANKDNIYFYTCEVGDGYFVLGKEANLTIKKDYDFDISGNLIFLGNKYAKQKLVLFYQPNENAYEIEVDKKIISVALEITNDFTGFMKKKTKRLVVR